MKDNIWNIEKEYCFIENLNDFLSVNNSYEIKGKNNFFFKTENPLKTLPVEIKLNLMSEYIEPGKASLSQNYFEKILMEDNFVPSLLIDLYRYALKTNNLILGSNIIEIASILYFLYCGF